MADPFSPANPPSQIQAWAGNAPVQQDPPADFEVDLSKSLLESGISTINLSNPLETGFSKTRIRSKEDYARWIAIYIVGIFGVTLTLLLICGFVLLIWLRWAPDKADQIFNKAVIPFVEKLGTFATTVFGPLLAFILGYYFGEKSQGSHTNSK